MKSFAADLNAAQGHNEGSSKIKMLVTYLPWHVGGATTSLVNFLQAIDFDKFDVDLLFYQYDNQGEALIPKQVNILEQAMVHTKFSLKNVLSKTLNPIYIIAKLRATYYLKLRHRKLKSIQIMAQQGCKFSRRTERKYDVALSYELTWPFYYMMKYVKADKKLALIHNDYDAMGYDIKEDKRYFSKADRLVFVSNDCREKFVKRYPEFKDKCEFMPNLTSAKNINALKNEPAEMPFEDNADILTFVTVSRIDFRVKALDRIVEVLKRLRADGLDGRVRWLVIGKGHDLENLNSLIAENRLEDRVFCIGLKTNPIAYMKHCDAMLLLSKSEGSPMVVVESQIAGVVPFVAEYPAAHSQIEHNVDGLIFKNDIDSIYSGIKDIVLNPHKLAEMRRVLNERQYDNQADIKYFNDIVEKLM